MCGVAFPRAASMTIVYMLMSQIRLCIGCGCSVFRLLSSGGVTDCLLRTAGATEGSRAAPRLGLDQLCEEPASCKVSVCSRQCQQCPDQSLSGQRATEGSRAAPRPGLGQLCEEPASCKVPVSSRQCKPCPDQSLSGQRLPMFSKLASVSPADTP